MGKTITFSVFLERSRNKHGTKFQYDESSYTSLKDKVLITCPIHGVFEQRGEKHINSPYGCTKCSYEQTSSRMQYSLTDFIDKAIKLHGTKFDYSRTNYIDSKTTISIICPTHGEFKMLPSTHLKGADCLKCSIETRAKGRTKDSLQFIKEVELLHKNKYNYDLVNYLNSKQKIIIVCKEHGEFLITPDNHLQGCGCPNCAVTGFNKTKPAILYYLSIDNGKAYKVGITNRRIQDRYSVTDRQKFEILYEIHFTDGAKAYEIEQELIQKYKQHIYCGSALLDSGHTEIFDIDISAELQQLKDLYDR